MNEDLIKQVEDLGLSNKEARVYLANLMLGAAGVQQIADLSGIKRVTTYVILEALVNLGLVSQTSHAKKTLFNAESPENLRRLLEKREQSIQEQKEQLNDLLPELGKLKTLPKDAPSVKFYDGAEGIRSVTQTLFTEIQGQDIDYVYGISNLDDLHQFFPEIAQQEANPSRLKSGFKSKFLYTTKRGAIYKDSDAASHRISRYLPLEKFNFEGDISIWGDYVVYLSLRGARPIGVVIKSHELAESMIALFELSWAAAKPYNS
jgi:HTH-type transcriptional regulator, sugar sensing transcriptional regulator